MDGVLLSLLLGGASRECKQDFLEAAPLLVGLGWPDPLVCMGGRWHGFGWSL